MKKMLIMCSLLLFLVGCVTAEKKLQDKGLKPMTQAELESLFNSDQHGNWKSPKGSGTLSYHPDGKSEVDWGSGNDKGSYQINDGKFCSTWTKIRNGKEGCFIVYKTGAKTYRFLNLDGSLNADLRLK